MSGGKDKGKGKAERHSTRTTRGRINKFTYGKLGTGGGTHLSMPRTSTTGEAVVISSDEEGDTTSPVAAPTGGTSQVVITDDDWEPTSPTGTSPVGTAGGWGGLALQPPLPLMGAVGGAVTGVVRARVAALEAATGAVATRTFPLLVRTEVVNAETQTDDMVLWSCHSCSQKK